VDVAHDATTRLLDRGLGADIGATLTVQLIAFHISDYAVLLIGTGLCFTLFSRKVQFRNVGQGVLGFGFVFLSLKIMTDAMTPLQGNELFREVFVALTGTPFAGIAKGNVGIYTQRQHFFLTRKEVSQSPVFTSIGHY
jgi:Na+/phosphate symporter